MKIENLSELIPHEQSVLYAALLSHLKYGDGYGLVNQDKNHIAYLVGRSGTCSDDMGDSPTRNTLFKAMNAISRVAFEYGEFAEKDVVHTWRDCCALVTENRNETKG